MNAVTASMDAVRDQLLLRFREQQARLGGDDVVRAQAAEIFRKSGLPGPHYEAWKYTNLRPLSGARFDEPGQTGNVDALLDGLVLPVGIRVVLVDGRPQPKAFGLHDGLSIRSFADEPEFGSLTRPDREPMVALNTMFARDGVVVSVPPSTDGGTVILITATFGYDGAFTSVNPRHRIMLGAGSRLSILELAIGEGRYIHNAVTEIAIGTGATLSHVRVQDESQEAVSVATSYVEIAKAAVYDSFTLNVGAQLCRTEVHAQLVGEGGATHLNAAQLLGGSQHADFTTSVAHNAPACASRQTVKNVLSGRSHGVFQGKIEVARVAQKTNGYQMNQALLLSPGAEIDSKPELEIYADDVKCSHGATVGELDEDQVFYLRSRGVSESEARSLLVRAFVEESLADVRHEGARACLTAALDRCWGRPV